MPKAKSSPLPLPSDLLPPLELLPLTSLRPHPCNTQQHPEDQLAHLRQSLTNHGVYRNIVVARDGTILAGHGVVLAAQQLGYTVIPGRRLDVDPDDPLAWQVLIGDNHIAQLSQRDDPLLAALLQEMQTQSPTALLGTGFDETLLNALLVATRPPLEPNAPDEFPEYTDEIATEHTCPRCGYEWSGGA